MFTLPYRLSLRAYMETMKTLELSLRNTFLLLIFLPAFFVKSQDENAVDYVPEGFYQFVNDFVFAVKAHDYDEAYNHLEKSYRKEQEKFLGSRKQLVDEMFGGFNELGDWMNTELNSIIEIWMMEYERLENDSYVLYFEVELERYILTVELNLQTGKKKKKWGFVGAMG